MADILEDEGHLWQPDLGAQKVVVIVLELLVRKMIPPASNISANELDGEGKGLRAGVAIQQRLRLHCLSPVLAPLALKRLMRLAERVLVEQEQLAQRVDREVALRVLFLVDDGGGQRLLVCLSLEDLLLDRPGGDETVYETLTKMSVWAEGRWEMAYILSSVRHARHEPKLVGQRQGSNLYSGGL